MDSFILFLFNPIALHSIFLFFSYLCRPLNVVGTPPSTPPRLRYIQMNRAVTGCIFHSST